MISIIQSIILGLVQGITEWLPVSSSGHLVITQQLFNLEVPLIYNIILHLATLLVIFTVFYKDIFEIVIAWLKFDFNSEPGQLGLFIIIGSIPTAIIGLAFKDLFTSFFSNLIAVGIALLFTGTILWISKYNNGSGSITKLRSIVIGIAQGIAIIPGISRSGTTISAGLLLGIKKKTIATYSFLLSVPAVLGATLLEFSEIKNFNLPLLPTIAGFLTAFIIGYICLKILLNLIIKNKFHYFSVYCWILGILVLSQSL